MKVGIISDTHGLIRKNVLKTLKGVDLIIHAGDIGKPEIITSLKHIAPVVAVRGNIDKDAWAEALPVINKIKINETKIFVIHNIEDWKHEDEKLDVLVYGHTHKPKFEKEGEVIYINPGSAGPRRFNMPISMSFLWIKGKEIKVKMIDLSGIEK